MEVPDWVKEQLEAENACVAAVEATMTPEGLALTAYKTWPAELQALAPKTIVIDFPPQLLDDFFLSDETLQSQFRQSEPEGPIGNVLIKEVEAALAALGGQAFVKAVWTAPVDASYCFSRIRGVPLAESVADVFILLKMSDRAMRDYLDGHNAPTGEASLLLREYLALDTDYEFRVMVMDARALSFSVFQRYGHYNARLEDKRDVLRARITQFIRGINPVVLSEMRLAAYVADIYVEPDTDKVYLIDISCAQPSGIQAGLFQTRTMPSYLETFYK